MDSDRRKISDHFICPISLQIMHDPVTTVTGITFERASIQRWLACRRSTTCPVTGESLPKDTILTPNHTLRRLIQTWLTDQDLPLSHLNAFQTTELLKSLSSPPSQIPALKHMVALASDDNHHHNRLLMAEIGIPDATMSFLLSSFRKNQPTGVAEALSLLYHLRPISLDSFKSSTDDILDSLTWVLRMEDQQNRNSTTMRTHAVILMRWVVKEAPSSSVMKLKREFFDEVLGYIRGGGGRPREGAMAALHVLVEAGGRGRNRAVVVEAGGVFDMIEMEMGCPDRKMTEVLVAILFQLCSTADGRARFLGHGGGVSVVSRRLLEVSAVVDDRVVMILGMICKYAGTPAVLREMAEVGAVAKLSMVLRSDGSSYLKEKARRLLREYGRFWGNSPCFSLGGVGMYVSGG